MSKYQYLKVVLTREKVTVSEYKNRKLLYMSGDNV